MKNLIYAFIICLLVTSCEKNESGQSPQAATNKRQLNSTEAILKENLRQAAVILANIIQDEEIMNELTLISNEGRTTYNLYFKDLLADPKGADDSFKTLRERFLQECESTKSNNGYGDLVNYIKKNNCYLYCPYPSSFYPKGIKTYTVAAHPIDNDVENVGYLMDGKKVIREVMVNEEYADANPVLLVMPRDEGEDEGKGEKIESIPNAKGDPVYEVLLGKTRCADFCGGLFEGTLELRISRGFPAINPSTGEVTGAFSVAIPVDYPRDYAKAAINDWTVHSNGGWYYVYIPWDSNWKPSKVTQGILVYEYDQVKEVTKSVTVGYKSDTSNVTTTVTAKTTYRGDFLGINEWDRDWFYATNKTPGPYDEVKDGWVVRKTCAALKLTTPARTIY